MKARVVVLGADGFIGRRVAAALAASDWASPALDGADGPELAGAHAIANCSIGDAATIRDRSTRLFAAIAGRNPPPRVVHLSSMTVYGSGVGTVDESSETRADLGPYSAAQLAAERLAGVHPDAVILRPGVEYGPECGPWSGRVAAWLRAGRLGDLGAAGDGICNLLFVEDLVACVLSALRTPGIGGETFNLAARDKSTWNDYFIAYAQALGAVPVPRISRRRLSFETRLFAPPLKAAALGAALLGLERLELPPPIPPSLIRACGQEIDMDSGKAERLLGAGWTPLDAGLRAAAAFYR